MTQRRMILEMGAGNDLHGGNYTKAALRAVDDALHHSSLSFLKSLSIDTADMQVKVTIGVQDPDAVDADQIRAALPHGEVNVSVVSGGLDVPTEPDFDATVIATAAIEVNLDLE